MRGTGERAAAEGRPYAMLEVCENQRSGLLRKPGGGASGTPPPTGGDGGASGGRCGHRPLREAEHGGWGSGRPRRAAPTGLSGVAADPGERAGTEPRPYTVTGSFCNGPMWASAPTGYGAETEDCASIGVRTGNPSVSLRLTAPFAQGSLWRFRRLRAAGTGDADCRVGLRPPRNDRDFLSFRGAKRRGNPFFCWRFGCGEPVRAATWGRGGAGHKK